MMRLSPFKYLAPRSLTEAADLLMEHQKEAALVGGGTDLYPNMKRRHQEPKTVISLMGIPELRRFESTTLGSCLTLSDLSTRPPDRLTSAVSTAARLVSTPLLRNMGTLGGNLCLDTRCNYYNQTEFWRHSIGYCMKKDGDICLVAPGSPRCWAISSSDCAPALIALQAQVRMVGPRGERTIPVAALYQDDGMQYLAKQRDEILAEVRLPPADGWRSVYRKLRRRGSFDFPILGVAIARLSRLGLCSGKHLDRDQGV